MVLITKTRKYDATKKYKSEKPKVVKVLSIVERVCVPLGEIAQRKIK